MSERFGRFIFAVIKPFLRFFMSDKLRTRALITNNGNVLLLRNWVGSQRWTLPGGGTHSGEAPKQGLKRELIEELGLDLDMEKFKQILNTQQHEETVDFPIAVFEIRIQKLPALAVNRPEIIEAKWFDAEKLPENLHPVVEQALKASKK